jgi:GT2 family glycosyltransferase
VVDISVCVPVYRRHPQPNIKSLSRQLDQAAPGLRSELVVVLNGLARADVDVPEHATVIELPVNRGVPVAWNVAARAARGRTLVFANDDVSLEPGSLGLLSEVLAREVEAGAVGPVGTRWKVSQAKHLSYVSLEGLSLGSTRECEVLSGFLFATPQHVYEASGGFDEAYTPCGFEEVDYCTTVRLDLGLKCLAVSGVDHQHVFGISAKRSWRRVKWDGRSESLGSIARRNRFHFLAKWGAKATSHEQQATCA